MRIFPAFSVGLLALSPHPAVAGLNGAEAAPPARKILFEAGQTIAFDGDSLTSRSSETRHSWSYLRLSNWQETWADVVEDWFFCNHPEMELEFRNAAIGGSSILELLARYDRTIKKIEPDWVLMTTGGNDSRRLDLQTYEEGLETYLRRLRDDFGARAVVVDMFHPDLWPAPPEAAAKRRRFMDSARRILDRYAGLYVNASDTLLARDSALKKAWEGHTVLSDGGHLNAVGARIVGYQVLQALGALTIH